MLMAGKAEDPGHDQYSVLDMIDRLVTTKSVAVITIRIGSRHADTQVAIRHESDQGASKGFKYNDNFDTHRP